MIKIFDQMWLKLIALLLGLLLWFHVATEKIYKYELKLPVEDVVLDHNLALSEPPPDSLTVIVSATGKQLLRQRWRERGLKIMATQLAPGRRQMTLNLANTVLISPSADVVLDDVVAPTTVTFHVDENAEATATVKMDIISEPDDGYAVSGVSAAAPSQVTVTGPRSIIEQISTVYTVRKELAGLRDNLDLILPLALPDGYGVSLDPDSISVSIRVVPVKTRVFEDVPVVVYNTPPNKTVVSTPASIRVEVTGPPQEIDLLNKNALIASADFAKKDSTDKAVLKIECPTKFRVKKSSVDTVTLAVQ